MGSDMHMWAEQERARIRSVAIHIGEDVRVTVDGHSVGGGRLDEAQEWIESLLVKLATSLNGHVTVDSEAARARKRLAEETWKREEAERCRKAEADAKEMRRAEYERLKKEFGDA